MHRPFLNGLIRGWPNIGPIKLRSAQESLDGTDQSRKEVKETREAKTEVMEEQEFKRVLALFPVVRSRDFRADQDSYGQSASDSLHDDAVQEWHDAWDNVDKNEQNNVGKDQNDAFWEKLKLAVEKKVGSTEAEKFVQGFQQVHRKLVYEVLSVDAAKKFITSSSGAQE